MLPVKAFTGTEGWAETTACAAAAAELPLVHWVCTSESSAVCPLAKATAPISAQKGDMPLNAFCTAVCVVAAVCPAAANAIANCIPEAGAGDW